ncbi:MAG: DNA translocase FtsK [bacterium]|nr:DNA translocase FtsK [bacterium]
MARRRQSRPPSHNRPVAAGWALVLVALVLGLAFLPGATGIPLTLARWQRLLLGTAAPALPAYVLIAGLILMAAGERVRLSRRIVGFLMGSATVLLVVHAWTAGADLLGAGLAGQGGGAIGGGLTWVLARGLGRDGMWAAVGVLAVLSLSLLTGVTLASAGAGLRAAARGGIFLATVLLRLAARLVRFLAAEARGLWAAVHARWVRRRRADRTSAQKTAQPVPDEPKSTLEVPLRVPTPGPEGISPPAIDPQTRGRARSKAPRADEPVQQERLAFASADYRLPPISMVGEGGGTRARSRVDPAETARALEQTLDSFGVKARVVHWEVGPVVTRFEVQPEPGVKVQRITSLTNDIALNLAAQSVRIEAPIPGKSAIGIELPNLKASMVHLREILAAEIFQKATSPLVVAVGKDIAGHPIVADLAEMPHLLIAGATGSGKSVALNAMIASLLFRSTPRQVRLVMIDPKRVELTDYNEIPHLLTPVVTNPRQAASVLKDMLRVMEQRFELFAAAGVRNIQSYNQLADVEPLYYIVIIVDELADLMMVAPADFEDIICRLAQMTRATGIHMVVATQRPSVDVITGLIKANIPSRLAFAVSSQVDSRTILDGPGAEKLLGRGDMLFMPLGVSRAIRAQGAYIADDEIRALVGWWRGQGTPVYDTALVEAQQSAATEESADGERLLEAARLIVRTGYGSVSLLQRKMRIGYVTAARLVDELEARGIVGPVQGSNPRDVLIGLDDLDRLLRKKVPPTS